MNRAERVFATPAGIDLGPIEQVADGGARNFVVQMRAGRFHGFVVRRGLALFGYVDRCPHMGLPLAQTLDAYLTPDGSRIACGWHGAIFAIEDGACLGGPCAGASLSHWPVMLRDGRILTA